MLSTPIMVNKLDTNSFVAENGHYVHVFRQHSKLKMVCLSKKGMVNKRNMMKQNPGVYLQQFDLQYYGLIVWFL